MRYWGIVDIFEVVSIFFIVIFFQTPKLGKMVLNLNVRICFKLLEGVVQPPAAYKKCLPILRTWTFWWNIRFIQWFKLTLLRSRLKGSGLMKFTKISREDPKLMHMYAPFSVIYLWLGSPYTNGLSSGRLCSQRVWTHSMASFDHGIFHQQLNGTLPTDP